MRLTASRVAGRFPFRFSDCPVIPSAVADTLKTVQQLENSIVVRGGKRFVRWFSTAYHGLKVLTPCPIPADPRAGGAILVSNHISSVDPVPLQAACPRLITWLMAKEYGNLFGL